MSCNFLFLCCGYLPLRRGYAPAFEGSDRFGGRRRSTAALDRRHRLEGRACRRRRQARGRRDDAGAGTRQRSGARDDGATLTDLGCSAADRRIRSRPAARPAAAARGATPVRALEAGTARAVCVQPLPPQSRARKKLLFGQHCRRTGKRDRHRAALPPALQPVGTAPVPAAGRRPVQSHARGPRSVLTDESNALPNRASPALGRRSRRGPRRYRHRTRIAGVRRHRTRCRRAGGRTVKALQLQGRDVQRRAQFCVVLRLRERIVDAEGRPGLPLRLQVAQPHASPWVVQCTPRNDDPAVAGLPWIDFSSGYLQRSVARFPKQGTRAPWRLQQNYLRDLLALRFGRIDDREMQFRAAAVNQ